MMIPPILKPYVMSFIAIFVAINVFGVLPVFIGLTSDLSKEERKKNVIESIITATTVALIFMLIGKVIFIIMGITVADFKIAGGILLLILSVNLLLPGETQREHQHYDAAGIFPIGTPLITGPAVLTTLLVLVDSYGPFPTFVSLITNMIIVLILLVESDVFRKTIGMNGMRAFSKVSDILLTAIAVMMIRRGIIEIHQQFFK